MTGQILHDIQEALTASRVVWRKHALARMMERGIGRLEVGDAIFSGEVIEQYPNDKPLPSFLVAGVAKTQMLHVVVAYDKTNRICYIITTYEPDTSHFEDDLKTRR